MSSAPIYSYRCLFFSPFFISFFILQKLESKDTNLSQRWTTAPMFLPPLSTLATASALTTHQTFVQSVQPFLRHESGCVRTHVQMYVPAPRITCVRCIATWSLNSHKIGSQLAEPFLSYRLVDNFETPYAARAICQADPLGMSSIRV